MDTPAEKPKFQRLMHEFQSGRLRSGGGPKVTKRKQAVAIAMAEARRQRK